MSDNVKLHGTTIVLVRKNNEVVVAGDGQINGKTKDILELKDTPNENTILDLVKQKDKIKRILENKKIIKKVYVPNKIISLVIK